MRAPDSDIDTLAATLVETMREAGALASGYFRASVKNWLKAGNSPVSEADIAVDTLLKERLYAIADAAWLSEETEDDPARLHAPHIWIVDPIDGTRAFIAGRTDWTISVALIEGARPILAALYAPATEEMFVAARGRGATLNGARITASPAATLSGVRVTGPKRLIDRLAAQAGGVAEQPKIFSLALRLARVADDSLDVAFAGGNAYDWDVAAADLIIHESGGALTDFAGTPLVYNRERPTHSPLLACGLSRHAALCDIMHAG